MEGLIDDKVVSHGAELQELRDKDVNGIPDTNYYYIGLVFFIVRHSVGEVSLVDPDSVINDAFSLETCELQIDVKVELHYLVRTCCKSSNTFKVFS